MFSGKAGAYPSEVPANIRLGWKGFPGSNALPYNESHNLRPYV